MRFFYIHGFASTPQSRKARQFHAAMTERGVPLDIPAMDQGDFEHLTITGQLELMNRTLNGAPASLIGSSMGGFLASLYAAVHPEVSRLILLAPAFGFAERWQGKIGQPAPPALQVFHYGDQRIRKVHYRLIEDALRYPAAPDFTQPALIFHGVHDDIVPIDYSRAFAASHPNVRLVELESDHELLSSPGQNSDVLDRIVAEATDFLLA